MHPLIETNRQTIAALCRHYGVRRLEVFGSILRDDFDPACSDVDVFAKFDSDSAESPLAQYFGFKEALEAIFGRPVDVVASGNIRNPYIRRAIENSRTLVYGA